MWEYNHTPDSDELMHYGILGMRWGVRRTKSELGSAKRERKASRKAEKYLYKADKLKAEKKNTKIDKKVAKLTAKGKHIAERERIDQEYSKDVQAAKSVERGKSYVANTLRGAVGGAIVGVASNRRRGATGKSAVARILTTAGVGAYLGSKHTAKTYKDVAK